jgi:hypothetical protein
MTDRTTPPAEPKKKKPGKYLSKIDEVPKEIRDYAINKLTPLDSDGNRIKDGKGNDVNASISAAKENGSYYGPVLLNNDDYLVQAVGKDRLFAIVHEKQNVAFQGAALPSLDAKKSLNGANIQIHYTNDKAKAYPWTDKTQKADAKEESGEKTIKPDELLKKAVEYADANIKNSIQRQAFLKHLNNVTERVFNKQQPEANQHRAESAPEKGKQTETGIER